MSVPADAPSNTDEGGLAEDRQPRQRVADIQARVPINLAVHPVVIIQVEQHCASDACCGFKRSNGRWPLEVLLGLSAEAVGLVRHHVQERRGEPHAQVVAAVRREGRHPALIEPTRRRRVIGVAVEADVASDGNPGAA